MLHKDKLEHALLSFLLAGLIYWLSASQLLTIFAVLLIGSLKEYYDQRRQKNTNRQSFADLLADVVCISSPIFLF